MIIYFNATPHTELDLLLLKGKSMSMLPDIETEMRSIPTRNGIYQGKSRLKERYFKIPFAVQGENEVDVQNKIEKIKRAFVNSLGQPRTIKMRFSWQDDRYYNVQIHGTTPYFLEPGYAEIEIEFVASDPFAYGITPVELRLTENMDGQEHSIGFIMQTAYAPIITFTCTDMQAGFDFEMTLEAREGAVTNGEKKTSVKFKNDTRFTIGDVVVVDCERHYVSLNGVDAMYLVDWHNTQFTEHTSGFSSIFFSKYWNAVLRYTPKYI